MTGPDNCFYDSRYVADITVPDNTQFAPGEPFSKVWRVRNSGTCSWERGTQLVYWSGDRMGGPGAIAVGPTGPGGTVDLRVGLIAPSSPGSHRSTWRLRTSEGRFFGNRIYVQIVVGVTPTPTPTPVTPTPPTVTPTPSPTPSAAPSGCILPTILEFKAVPPTPGSGARFALEWTVDGADRAEIFGTVVDPVRGRFDVWDDQTNYWVLWTKVWGTAADCYAEQAILVDPDSITPAGPGLTDVTVSQRAITISVRDHQSIDGDIIDLYLNGNKILSSYTLTSTAHGVNVKLNSGENEVTVVALNEGASSPNTVEVSISHVVQGDSVQISVGMKTGQSASFKIIAP